MYEHRENASQASGLSHDNSKTLIIRLPAGEPEGPSVRLVLEIPGLPIGILSVGPIGHPWLLDLHDRIGRLLGRPTWRQVGALRLAAAHVLDNWTKDDHGRYFAADMRELGAALDDMP